MFRLIHLFQTSIGTKQLMALTGIVLVLFALGHMLGNMTVYQGPEMINAYAAWLQGHPLLWVFRVTMLAIVALHIALAIRVARENRAARPQAYARKTSLQATLASRSMLGTGIVITVFIIYHLLHLTAHQVGPVSQFEPEGRMDVYANLVNGFSNPWIAWGYVLGMLLLGLHLSHAIQSFLQTLGLTHHNWEQAIRIASPALAWLIALGFISIPVAVQFGLLSLGGAA
jgi:succinate dehydrogenase / fumarate reductase cytochrome b subunit